MEMFTSREERSLLASAAELAVSERPFREIVPALCASLAEALRVAEVTIFLREDDAFRPAGNPASVEPWFGAAAREALQRRRLTYKNRQAVAPLRSGDREIGVVAIGCGAPLDPEDVSLVETWASIVALRIHSDVVETDNARLFSIAGRDQLTGIANRRTFDAHLLSSWDRARRSGASLSLVLVDIDFFKSYNDRYGHLAGDTALYHVAQALQACLHRPNDLLARFGGEEFVVVLEDAGEEGAVVVAEQMRRAVIELQIANDRSQVGYVTMSAGIASERPRHEDSISALLSRADAALYQAKDGGRNRVVGPTYRSEGPAVLRRGAGTNDIALSHTSFVGRENDLTRLRQSIVRSRLVTLTGLGGAGKSRLSTRAAADLTEFFPDGLWYADLSSAMGTRDSLTAIAIALGLKERPNASLFESVVSRLKSQQALVVLDGCERACPALRETIHDVLSATNHLHVLLVSRETFGLPGEAVVRIGGLEEGDAVELFLARARASGETSFDSSAIAAICREVDFLPLAIEIVAARAATLPVEKLQLVLTTRLIALKSLDDVVDWSVKLLDERHRELIADLSVFAADFSAAAAFEVAGASAADLEAFENKSLLSRVPSEGEKRYRLLDTTRDVMRGRVTKRKLEVLREKHFRYYAALARATVPAVIVMEREQLRAALIYAEEIGDTVALLRLATDLAPHYLQLGFISEGLNWLRLGIANADDGTTPEVMALACRQAGMLARRINDIDAAREYNTRALELMRRTENAAGVTSALNGLALIAHMTGEFDRAEILYGEALAAHKRSGDALGIAQVTNNMAGLALYRGRYDDAYRLFTEALAKAEVAGNEKLRALTISNIAELRLLQQRYAEAAVMARESLEIRLASAEKPGLAASWLTLGHALIAQSATQDAWAPLRESLLLYYEMGDRRGVAAAIYGIVRLLLVRGRTQEASLLFSSAESIYAGVGVPMFGADRIVRDANARELVCNAGPVLDYEDAFEYALATFQ